MASFKNLGTVVSYPSGGTSQQEIDEIIDNKGSTEYKAGTHSTLSMFGQLSSTSTLGDEERQVYIATPVTDSGGNGSAYMPDYEAKATRIITHGLSTDRSGKNMMTANQASVETNVTGFTATGGSTITRDTTEKYEGLASLKIVTTTSILSGVDLTEVPATAGVHYSFRCMIKGDGNMMLRMYAYNSSNVDIGVVTATIFTTSTWQEFKIENYTAPAGTAKIIIKIGTPQANIRTVYFDAAQLEVGLTSTALEMPGSAPLAVGNFDIEWVGRKYGYTVVPSVNYILQRIYWRLGNTLVMDASTSISIKGYKGHDETGIKILERTISAGTAPYAIVPGAEVYVDIPNLDYREGEELHWTLEVISSNVDHQMSLMTNEDNAQPWRAVDGQRFEMKAMVPTDALYANLIVTNPTAGATGVSLTPTVSTIKGVSKYATFQGGTTVTAPNNTDYNTLFDIPMAPNFMGSKGSMIGTILLRHTGVGAKDIILGLGGSIIYSTSIFTTGEISVVEFALYAKSISLQTISASITGDDGVIGTNTIDLITPTSLILTAKKSVSTNIFELMGYDIFITNSDSELVGEYLVDSTEVKVKEAATQKTVYQDVANGLSGTVTEDKKLKGSTLYNAYARHKTSSGLLLPWSQSVSFKTLMDLTISVLSGITAGELVEIDIGESATATGYDFHLSGLSDKFPSVAFDSGEFRFKDSASVDLLFKVQSVTGTTPNRVAKCYVETNTQVIADSKIKLIGVGASATNVSQSNTMWASTSTGGTITIDGDYRVHTFTANGTFTPDFTRNITALVVGGGAGGDGGVTSGVYGHGGGGGFVNYSDAFSVAVLDTVKKVKRIRLRLSGNTVNSGAHLKEFDIRDASNARIMNTNMVLTTGANSYSALLTAESNSEIGKAFDGLQTTHWTLSNATGQSFGIYQEGIFTFNSASILSSVSAVCYYDGGNRKYYRCELDVQYEDVAGTNPNGSDGTWTNVVVAQEIGGIGGTQLEATRTVTNSGTPIPVNVGTGGAAGAINTQAANGVASSIGGLTASGGLKANNIGAGGDGGDSGKTVNGVTTNYNGGADSTWGAAGGSGAGSTSAGASDANGSSGGAGYTSSITGSPFEYAKGGNGSGTASSAPTAPAANTGHGGHGAGTSGMTNGSSGTVIVRYPMITKTIHADKFVSLS